MTSQRFPNTATLAALIGFGVSCWLSAEYHLPLSRAACPFDSGCLAVRSCRGLLVPPATLPALGVLAFGAALALSLSGGRRIRNAARVTAPLAVLAGVALLAAQALVCRAFCAFCIVVDLSAIFYGVATLLVGAEPVRVPRALRRTVMATAAASVVASAAWMITRTPSSSIAPLPPAIAGEQRPGITTIVAYLSFWCPHCQEQRAVLDQVLPHYGQRVRLVERYPIPNVDSPMALPARATYCAAAQGGGAPMAAALFERARGPGITREALAPLATQLALDDRRLMACLDTPAITEQLHRDGRAFVTLKLPFLPVLCVGAECFGGNMDGGVLRAHIDHALRETEGLEAR